MYTGTVPWTFRNTNVKNQNPNEDGSENGPHPEVGPSVYQSRHSNDSDSDEAPNIVTGVQEGKRYRLHMVTGVKEEFPYCSPVTSSGKPK